MNSCKNLCLTIVAMAVLFFLSAEAQAKWVSKNKLQSLQDAVEKMKKERDDCSANLAASQKKADEEHAKKNENIQSLTATNAQLLKDLDSNKNELQKRVADLVKEKQEVEKIKTAEVEKLKSTYDNLVQGMKKEIQQGSIQITQLKDKLTVSLVEKIVFNSGESEVNEQGKQILKRVADILKKVQDKQIRIEGHTDNIPIGGLLKDRFPTNWELSTARATSVSRYLQDSGGIDPKVLYAAGYGQHRPIADNLTSDGRSKNRRIEIALVPLDTASAVPSSSQNKASAPPTQQTTK
ncbi:MAG: OmpA family protein [Elusimicrobia bacterium]|nr:OmpA family protein [Elusimicrobiota bacterium]